MKSKFSLFFLFFIISVIFLSVGAIHANETATIAKDTMNDHISIDKNVEDKQIIKNKKSNSYGDKKQSSNIILNSTTFDDYVTGGNFNEKVNRGDTIDVQGVITSSNGITVNKMLNFISTTNDGTFNSGVFTVNSYSNGSTFTGLTFDNTHLRVASTSNIVFDNISTLNIGKGIGAGVGSVSIREGSNNITLKNSYFLTNNNGGHSNVVFASAQNCLFENNTIESHGNVGNDFYITTYNVPAGLDPRNMNITIRNNTLRSTASGPITVGMVLSGYGHLIENNIIDKPGNSIMSQWSDPTWDDPETTVNNEIGNITFRNNQIVNAGSSLTFQGRVYNNSFTGASIKNSECYNNTFQTVSFLENTYFYNNTITNGNLSMGMDNIVENIHSLGGLNIGGSNNTLSNISVNTTDVVRIDGDNNTINNLLAGTAKNLNIGGSNNILANSTIYSDERFAVTLRGNNNLLENIHVEASRLTGKNAIYNYAENNILINITPENGAEYIIITDENYYDYFNVNGNLARIIPDNSVITFKGTFNDKDFILKNFDVDIMTDEFNVNNGTIKITGTSSLNISTLTINNRNSEKTRALIIDSDNNNITSIKILDNGNKEDYNELTINGNNNILSGSISMFNDEVLTNNPFGVGIYINSENNRVEVSPSIGTINNFTGVVFSDKSKNNYYSHDGIFLNSGLNHTGMMISGTGNKINNTRVYVRVPNGQCFVLNNANNSIIESSYGVYANELPITLINSNNNIIEDFKFVSSTNNVAILLVNSTNNTIKNCNNITSNKMYTIELYNSSFNTIEHNYIQNNQTYGGNNAINEDENSEHNKLLFNLNTIVTLNDNTYDYLFKDNILINGNIINIDGDIHNKTMIFNNGVTINGNNHKIYDSLIIMNKTYKYTPNTKSGPFVNNIMENNIINNLNIIASDIETALIINTNTTLNNVKINHSTFNPIKTIIVNNEELKTTNSILNINSDGEIIAITDNNSNSKFDGLMININSNGECIAVSSNNSNSNYNGLMININSNGECIAVSSNNSNSNYNGLMININSNGECVAVSSNNSNSNYNGLTCNINATKAIGLLLNNFNKELNDISLFINATEVTGVKLINSHDNKIKNNQFNLTANKGRAIELDNVTNTQITNNNIEMNIPTKAILIQNSNMITVTSNNIESQEYYGNAGIEVINSEDTTISDNLPKPYILLTDDNYNTYFQNSILIDVEGYELIRLGSNLYNKDLIITSPIDIDGRGYTIYNGTITLNESLKVTNIKINNTGNQESCLIINAIVNFEYNSIYQEGNNKTSIKIENVNVGTFNNNQILVVGDNNNIIYLNNAVIKSNNFINNNITSIGDNNTVINYSSTSSLSYMSNNNIKVKSKVATTPIIIDNSRVRFNNNQVLVNTTMGTTPIVKVITNSRGQVNNNYLESLDLSGNDAVDTPGTKSGNTPSSNNHKITLAIAINDTLIPTVESKITIDVQDMLDNPIEGLFTATINEETVEVTDKTISYTPTKLGNITVKVTYTDPNGKYETKTATQVFTVEKHESTTEVTTEEITIGDSTNITASFFTEDGVPVTTGKAIFRVNGKTLRNNNGEVIYVDVTNGKAELPDVKITSEWLKPDTTIQAVYSGNNEFEPIFTQITSVTVTKPEATITITSDLEAKAGDNITLSASVTDNELPVNSGRVVFKLNGKTLKDENGKALYVDVKDGVATTNYILPVKTKAKTYTLTAVFTDTNYNRSEAEADFVVTS